MYKAYALHEWSGTAKMIINDKKYTNQQRLLDKAPTMANDSNSLIVGLNPFHFRLSSYPRSVTLIPQNLCQLFGLTGAKDNTNRRSTTGHIFNKFDTLFFSSKPLRLGSHGNCSPHVTAFRQLVGSHVRSDSDVATSNRSPAQGRSSSKRLPFASDRRSGM